MPTWSMLNINHYSGIVSSDGSLNYVMISEIGRSYVTKFLKYKPQS